MIIRAVTANNDWTFGSGITNYLSGQLAVEQNIRSRLLSWLGDCYFDMTEGIDWINYLSKGSDYDTTSLIVSVKSVILQSYGVVTINSLEIDVNPVNRSATVSANINTIFSQNALISIPIGGQ